jgi:hypothetical protein
MVVIYRIHHGSRGSPDHASDMPRPMVIRDHLDDMISPLDGKPQTSKRSYYRQLRQAGCEINDKASIKETNRPEHNPSGLKADIAGALRELRRDFKGQ